MICVLPISWDNYQGSQFGWDSLCWTISILCSSWLTACFFGKSWTISKVTLWPEPASAFGSSFVLSLLSTKVTPGCFLLLCFSTSTYVISIFFGPSSAFFFGNSWTMVNVSFFLSPSSITKSLPLIYSWLCIISIPVWEWSLCFFGNS